MKRGLVLLLTLAPALGSLYACGSDDSSGNLPDGAPPGGGAAPGAGGGPVPGAGLGQPSGSPYPRCQADFCTPVQGAEPCCVAEDGPCGADYGQGCVRIGGGNGDPNPGNGGRPSGNTGGRTGGSGGRRGGGSGGRTSTGGMVSTGGVPPATGGAVSTGGNRATGGAPATGGANDGDAATD